jgi:hypothetical protein
MSGYQSSNMAGEMWVQWFSCCINQRAAQQVNHLHFMLVTATSQPLSFSKNHEFTCITSSSVC